MRRLASITKVSLLPRHSSSVGADKTVYLRFVCAVFVYMSVSLSAFALDRAEADKIPHVNKKARDNFIHYIYSDSHKAFAIAPGGTWAWTESEVSEDQARIIALMRCQQHTEQKCVLYSLNDKIVFDADAWPRLWRARSDQAKTSEYSISRHTRFPDLRFADSNGRSLSIRHFSGKITLIHFWGSWCAPCLREFPVLLELQTTLRKNFGNDVEMVLLQVRESFDTSYKWAQKYDFDKLPLYDSGVKDVDDSNLTTTDGKSYPDRMLARVFPTSYVLDRKGNVLFSHYGPISNWSEYLPFFTDVVKHKAP